jgi:cell division transport system ATP-binding protein
MMLQTFNLTKKYDSGGGIFGIDLEIKKGDFILLRGANGAGKSTLIRLLSLFEQPDQGSIQLDRMNTDRLRTKDFPKWRKRLGVIPQDLKLLNNRTVFENIIIGQRGGGLSRRKSKQLALKILAQVGLSHRLGEIVGNLSGGEARRTSIARALCGEPFILLADEPMGDLDPDTALDIMKLFEKINSLGTAILMVTHRQDIVPGVKHTYIEMDNGRFV